MKIKTYGIIIITVFFICTNALAISYNEQIKLNKQFMRAAATGRLTEMKKLVEQGADINYKIRKGRHNYLRTPLHEACRGRRFVAAKYLIENGADVDAKDGQGFTPLILATRHGSLVIVKLLVENGADVRLSDRKFRSALWYAKNENKFKAIIKYLIENQ